MRPLALTPSLGRVPHLKKALARAGTKDAQGVKTRLPASGAVTAAAAGGLYGFMLTKLIRRVDKLKDDVAEVKDDVADLKAGVADLKAGVAAMEAKTLALTLLVTVAFAVAPKRS